MALARVVDVEGSGPRGPGAAMAVNEQGEVAGSVSGGCVEGAVVTEALAILGRRGRAAHRHVRLQRRRGVRRRPDVRRHDPPVHRAAGLVTVPTIYEQLRDRIRAEQPVALATVIDGPARGAKLLVAPGEPRRRHARRPRPRPRRRPRHAGRAGGRPLGRAPLRPAGPDDAGGPRGLADHPGVRRVLRPAAADVDLRRRRLHRRPGQGRQGARLPGDGRATPARSSPPAAASRWPTRSSCRGRARCSSGAATTLGPRDAVCVLTHDNKFDVPAVQGALATDVGYIGVMGSRTTHDKRLQRLLEAGVAPGRPRPADVADRPRPRRPHAGGDGDLDLRRDHRHPHRQGGPQPQGLRGPDPRLTPVRSRLAPGVSCAGGAAAIADAAVAERHGRRRAGRRAGQPVGSPKRTERLVKLSSTSVDGFEAWTMASPTPRYSITWPGYCTMSPATAVDVVAAGGGVDLRAALVGDLRGRPGPTRTPSGPSSRTRRRARTCSTGRPRRAG